MELEPRRVRRQAAADAEAADQPLAVGDPLGPGRAQRQIAQRHLRLVLVLRLRRLVQDRRDVDGREVDEQLPVEREPPPAPRAADGDAEVAALARDVRQRGQVVADRVGGVDVEARQRLGQPQRRAVDRRRVVACAAVGASRSSARGGGRARAACFRATGFRTSPLPARLTSGAASSRGASSPAARATFACASVTISGTAKSASLPDNGLNPRVPRSGSTSQVLVPTRQKSVCRRFEKLQQSAHELTETLSCFLFVSFRCGWWRRARHGHAAER